MSRGPRPLEVCRPWRLCVCVRTSACVVKLTKASREPQEPGGSHEIHLENSTTRASISRDQPTLCPKRPALTLTRGQP